MPVRATFNSAFQSVTQKIRHRFSTEMLRGNLCRGFLLMHLLQLAIHAVLQATLLLVQYIFGRDRITIDRPIGQH
jgi:hypothetical protein